MHNAKIYFKSFGEGRPVIFLHGLLGTHSQWLPFVKEFENCKIILPDLPNHGDSGHLPTMNIQILSKALNTWINSLNTDKITLVGHSFGGKIAIQLVHDYPHLFEKLILIDSSPFQMKVSENISQWFRALKKTELENYNSFASIKKTLLEQHIPEREADLLLKNIKKVGKNFSWKSNVNVIIQDMASVMENVKIDSAVNVSTYILRGVLSNYVSDNTITEMKMYFPLLKNVEIENAGHWVHADNQTEFINCLRSFLNE